MYVILRVFVGVDNLRSVAARCGLIIYCNLWCVVNVCCEIIIWVMLCVLIVRWSFKLLFEVGVLLLLVVLLFWMMLKLVILSVRFMCWSVSFICFDSDLWLFLYEVRLEVWCFEMICCWVSMGWMMGIWLCLRIWDRRWVIRRCFFSNILDCCWCICCFILCVRRFMEGFLVLKMLENWCWRCKCWWCIFIRRIMRSVFWRRFSYINFFMLWCLFLILCGIVDIIGYLGCLCCILLIIWCICLWGGCKWWWVLRLASLCSWVIYDVILYLLICVRMELRVMLFWLVFCLIMLCVWIMWWRFINGLGLILRRRAWWDIRLCVAARCKWCSGLLLSIRGWDNCLMVRMVSLSFVDCLFCFCCFFRYRGVLFYE